MRQSRHSAAADVSAIGSATLVPGPSDGTMHGSNEKIAITPGRGENAMDLGLQGKHAVVTGGSRGIGKAIAREFAREGVDVAIVARNKADIEATARELGCQTNRGDISGGMSRQGQ